VRSPPVTTAIFLALRKYFRAELTFIAPIVKVSTIKSKRSRRQSTSAFNWCTSSLTLTLRSKALLGSIPSTGIPFASRKGRTVDVMDEIAKETGKTHAQIALNWLLQRPTVTSVIFGARNEEQLRANLGTVGWQLTPDQVARLDAASAIPPIYPYWHQRGFAERNPLAV